MTGQMRNVETHKEMGRPTGRNLETPVGADGALAVQRTGRAWVTLNKGGRSAERGLPIHDQSFRS